MSSRYTSFPRLSRFNRECEFTIAKPQKVSGVEYKVGDVLDKTLVTTRRLRQLFDQRKVSQGLPPHLGPTVPAELDFAQLPTAAVVEWLAQRKKAPRHGSNRTGIINLARVVLEKEKAAAKEKETEGGDVVPTDSTENRDPQRVSGKAPKRDAQKADA